MAQNPLPAQVQQALERGHLIEAIKLLREASGLGLAEAKHAIEAHANRVPEPGGGGIQAPPSMPIEAVAALQRGNKIEAIRLYRAHNRVDLKQAKEAVDAFEASSPTPAAPGLAPGEVPPSKNGVWWLAAFVIGLAILGFMVLRRMA